MDVLRLIEVRLDAETIAAAAQAAECRLGRLLHHGAEVAGQLELAAAGHDVGLHLEDLAADLCPCKAVYHADLVVRAMYRVLIPRRAEQIMQTPRCDGQRLYIRCHQCHCRLAAELPEQALELAHAGLTRIARDNGT